MYKEVHMVINEITVQKLQIQWVQQYSYPSLYMVLKSDTDNVQSIAFIS